MLRQLRVRTGAQSLSVTIAIAGTRRSLRYDSETLRRSSELFLVGATVPRQLVALDVERSDGTAVTTQRLAPSPRLSIPRTDSTGTAVLVRRWQVGRDVAHHLPEPLDEPLIDEAHASARHAIAGDWYLDVVHRFDVVGQVVHFGDGRVAPGLRVQPGDHEGWKVLDGNFLLHHFASDGRHLTTEDPAMGVVLLQVDHDDVGLVRSVRNRSGAILSIDRGVNGEAVVLRAGDGCETVIELDDRGVVASIRGPDLATMRLESDAARRLVALVTPLGNRFVIGYDGGGQVESIQRPSGGGSALRRVLVAEGTKVVRTTSCGVERSQLTGIDQRGDRRLVVDCCGAPTTTSSTHTGDHAIAYADGSVLTESGDELEAGRHHAFRTPGGLQSEVVARRSLTSRPGAPDLTTDSIDLDGAVWAVTIDPVERRRTQVSPEGRWQSFVHDERGAVVRIERSGLPAITISRDALDRVTALRGGRTDIELGYEGDAAEVAFVRGPDGETMRCRRDAARRLVQIVGASGSGEAFGYDVDGRLTAIVRPSGRTHAFGHDPDGALATWTTPLGRVHTLDRDADGRIIEQRTAAGRRVRFSHDVFGRIVRIDSTQAAVDVARDAIGRIVSLVRTDQVDPAGTLPVAQSFGWDGPWLTGVRWSDPVDAGVGWAATAGLRLSAIAVEGMPVHTITRDRDGLVTSEDSFVIERDPATGTVLRISDGCGEWTRTVDEHGFAVESRCSVAGRAIFESRLAYDPSGRVERIEETLDGSTRSRTFTYDPSGQLMEVRDGGGEVIERYTYDVNGNRISADRPAGHQDASFDDDDHLVSLDSTAIQVDADGVMTRIGQRELSHGDQFELLSVRDGEAVVNYRYDGFGIRCGRATDGAIDRRWMTADPRSPSSVTHAADGTRAWTRHVFVEQMLVAVERDGQRWYVAVDQVGTPRAVIDAAGNVVDVIDRDSFGMRTASTPTGFPLEIGFAGGVEDPTTGFVRFCRRDYDPILGRWTTPDPVGFASPDHNLWRYCWNDPVNYRDPLGAAGALTAGTGGTPTDTGEPSQQEPAPKWLTDLLAPPTHYEPGPPSYTDYDGPTATPTPGILDLAAGELYPIPGLTDQGEGFGAGHYSNHVGRASCRIGVGSGNVFPYPTTPDMPGTTEYTDFGMESGPSAGGTITIHLPTSD